MTKLPFSFTVQHRSPTGWRTLETEERKALAFKQRSAAEKRALELSAANNGHLFRVVEAEHSMTGTYQVYMSGQPFLYDDGTLILYPGENGDVQVIDVLLAPALDKAITPEDRERIRCEALGQLVRRWAAEDARRIQRVCAAAKKG
jgi:hypothetical protein